MLHDVALDYLKIIIQFLAELYIFYAIVMFRLARGRHFCIKFFGGLFVVAVIAFGAAFFYYFYGGAVLGRIAVYVFLFVVSTLHLWLSSNESYKTILFFSCIAYAIQNAVYKLFLVLLCFCEQFRLFDGWSGSEYSLYYRLIYYSFFIMAAVCAYFFLIRRHIRRISVSDINLKIMVMAIFILFITIVLCSVEDIHFATLSSGRENRYDDFDVFVLRQSGNFFSVICCAAVVLLTSQTLFRHDLQKEVGYLQHIVRQSERQYEISKDTINMINIKCHDIKYKINSMLAGGGAVTTDAIADLQNNISIYDTLTNTGNKILDVLLTEKSLYCEQNDITFSSMADGSKLGFMSDGDLYCLFGNIIDNALEAVYAISDRERRVVNLVIKEKNGIIVVQEENYFEGEITFKDGLPQTTKSDKNYHGFGMSSIQMLVNKYGGAMSTHAKDGVFYLCIIFSSVKPQKEQIK